MNEMSLETLVIREMNTRAEARHDQEAAFEALPLFDQRKRHFLDLIAALQDYDKTEEALRTAGMDLMLVIEPLKGAVTSALALSFTKEQISDIEWWLYDCPNGISGTVNVENAIITITDSHGATEHLIDSPEALWAFIHTEAC